MSSSRTPFNVTYARRNRVTFIVNLAANLGAGALLSAIATLR